MSIEQIIKYLPTPLCGDTVIGKEKQKEYTVHDSAVIILHKYQKITEIVKSWRENGLDYDSCDAMDNIEKVIDDGNDGQG